MMEKNKDRQKLINALDTMFVRTIADMEREWGTNEKGREFKVKIREAYQQIRQLLQQKPERKIEIDEKYIEERERKLFDVIIKAESINGTFDKHFSCSGKIGIEKRKEFITQVVRDVKGNRASNDG